MGNFQRKWTPEQHEAMASARLDRRMTYKRITELARAGELSAPDGGKLEPFAPPLSTVASIARDAKKRRMGEQVSELAQLPHRDAIDALRRRFLSACDAMLKDWEKMPAAKRDPERLRQIVRCAREAQALPDRAEPAKPAPGQKTNGDVQGATTQGGLGGSLLAAHRQQGSTAPDATSKHEETQERTDAERSSSAAEEQEGQEDGSPGSFARSVARRQLVA